jgi:hypothetical protein
MSDGLRRQILPKKRSLWFMNEHFEGEFNAIKPGSLRGRTSATASAPDLRLNTPLFSSRMNNYASQIKTYSDTTGHALATRNSTAQAPGAIVFQHPVRPV